MFILALLIASLIPILSIAFQVFVLLNPSIATITIYPISKEISLRTDILAASHPTSNEILSIPLRPVSFSQSDTMPASGQGHQNASYAKGILTFYNGSFSSRIVPQNTQLTGSDGVNVVTDSLVTIPPSTPTSPPTFGEAKVSAHAMFTGPNGNISAMDINSYDLGPSILAQNTDAFYGGMDARDFKIVTLQDIDNALNPLKKAASQSIESQILSQVKAGEGLFPLNCSTSISLDHKAGDEAASIKVSYVKTCNSIKYIKASLFKKSSDVLNATAKKQLGEKYFPALNVKVSVLNTAMKGGKQNAGILTVSLTGDWFYHFSAGELKRIGQKMAGKPLDRALAQIKKVPGVLREASLFLGLGMSTMFQKTYGTSPSG